MALVLGAAVYTMGQDLEPVEITRVPSYCEGVVFDHDGNAYISHERYITQVSFAGDSSIMTSIWAETGAPNGHKVLADGTHLACDGSQQAVLHLDKNGRVIGKASSECEGKARDTRPVQSDSWVPPREMLRGVTNRHGKPMKTPLVLLGYKGFPSGRV